MEVVRMFFLEMKIPSGANTREHHMVKARRVKRQRRSACWATLEAMEGLHVKDKALSITMIRQSPRPLDFDNLAFSLKAIRDGIADGLGLDDDRERLGLIWTVGQTKGSPQGVQVKIEVGEASP